MTFDLIYDLSLAGTITEYLTSAMVDNYSNGDKATADQQAIDSCIVQGMRMCLDFYDVHGIDTDFDNVTLDKIKYVIHEFEDAQLLDVSNFSVNVGYDSTALGAVNPIMVLGSGTSYPTPHTYIVTISSDGQTVLAGLPFNIDSIDPDSVSVMVNDDGVDSDNYSITGTTLTWGGEYTLLTGWKVEIKYWA